MTDFSEDDLLRGVTDALTAGGWLWSHHRRSDLGQLMGTPGLPDIVAIHPERGETFVAELKSEHGRLSEGQAEWLDAFTACGIPARIVRPDDYDETVAWLVGDRLIGTVR